MSAIQTPQLLASLPAFEPEEMSLDVRQEALSSHIPCAICIVQDEIHDMMSRVRRSIYGTMRCHQHTLECASCHGEVETDAQLLCLGCSDSGAGAIYHEILFSRPPTRMCRYEFVTAQSQSTWACGCPRCMQQTAQFFVARCLEEGLSSHSAPPSPSASDDEEHISFQVAMSLFN